jgi:hypothetical protein
MFVNFWKQFYRIRGSRLAHNVSFPVFRVPRVERYLVRCISRDVSVEQIRCDRQLVLRRQGLFVRSQPGAPSSFSQKSPEILKALVGQGVAGDSRPGKVKEFP